MKKWMIAGAFAGALTMASPVWADDYAVIEAKLTLDHRAGSVLTPDSMIKLLPGSSITVMSSAGEMLVIKGPKKGKLSEALSANSGSGEESDPALIGAVSALFKGDSKSRKSLAAFRAVGQPNGGKLNYKTKNPWHVSTIKDGTYCVREDQVAGVLWNPRQKLKTGTLSMGAQSVDLTWDSGVDMDWPAAMKLKDGGAYSFSVKGAQPVQMKVHTIKSGPFAQMVKEMADKGCVDQGRNLLKAYARGELK